MAVPDYYNILGIDRNASSEEIKKAYYKLARKHHPDLHKGDEAESRKFQQINEAYEVLKDPDKRRKYDAFGTTGDRQDQFEGFGRGDSGFYGEFSDQGFSDFFESLFGRQSSSDIRYKGRDLEATLELNLEQIFKEFHQIITINNKQIRIKVPAGIEDGQKIRLRGYGQPGFNGGPAGDLYISFVIKNPAGVERKGADLYKTENIDLYTAVLGGEVLIEGINEKLKLKIAPETKQGAIVRLKGKGVPLYKKKERGDLYITLMVQLPEKLSEEEIELFKKLRDLKK